MKVEDLRKQTKPCYIHNLHIGDTFLLDGELYYIHTCNDTERIMGAINLTSNNIKSFYTPSSLTVTPVKCKICILEDEQF